MVILAADVVYSEEHPELLSKTILRWLAAGPASRAVIAYPLRVAYLGQIRELWELLEAGGLEAIEEGREQASTKDWDDECLPVVVVVHNGHSQPLVMPNNNNLGTWIEIISRA